MSSAAMDPTMLAVFVAGLATGAVLGTAPYWWARWMDWLNAGLERRAATSVAARLRITYGLTGRQAELAATAYRRWQEGRCPFCGYAWDPDRARCEAQQEYIERTARSTFETRDGDAIIEGIFREEDFGGEGDARARG